MTSGDEEVNQRRLGTLVGIVDGLPPLLRFGRLEELVQTLVQLQPADRKHPAETQSRLFGARVRRGHRASPGHRRVFEPIRLQC